MATHSYTDLTLGLPPIPILRIKLGAPSSSNPLSHNIQGILDTGSDCTLIPIPDLLKVEARVIDRAMRIPVCGQIVMAIPYAVGLRFDAYSISSCAVFGCAVEEIGELSIIGRDLMNRYQILFNGLASEFTVF
jgi:hypothetical protein